RTAPGRRAPAVAGQAPPCWAWRSKETADDGHTGLGVGVVHIPATVSLGVIVAIIATAVLLSAWQQRRQARPAAHPHHLHTGCAGPAPPLGVLEASTRQVATDGEQRQDAVLPADATARPAVTAVAK